MQSPFLAALIGIVAVSPAVTGTNTPGPALKHETFQGLSMQDVALSEGSLAEVTEASVVSCGQQCVAAERCVMFTFLPRQNAPSGVCRIYGQLPSSSAGQQNWPGARSFAVQGLSGSDYSLVCGHHILLVTTSLNFSQARQNCEDHEQGRLLVIHNLQDIACVYNFVISNGVSDKLVWLGLDGDPAEGRYVWHDGTELPVGSDLWGPGQPERLFLDNCLVLHYLRAKVHDVECNLSNPSLCEKGGP